MLLQLIMKLRGLPVKRSRGAAAHSLGTSGLRCNELFVEYELENRRIILGLTLQNEIK